MDSSGEISASYIATETPGYVLWVTYTDVAFGTKRLVQKGNTCKGIIILSHGFADLANAPNAVPRECERDRNIAKTEGRMEECTYQEGKEALSLE